MTLEGRLLILCGCPMVLFGSGSAALLDVMKARLPTILHDHASLVLSCINKRYMGRRVRARGLQEVCRPRALTRRYR